MDELEALRRIRRKLELRLLPRALPDRVWAGPGTGAPCAACDDCIARQDVEIEAECADGQHRLYHERCFAVLSRERAPGMEARSGASA